MIETPEIVIMIVINKNIIKIILYYAVFDFLKIKKELQKINKKKQRNRGRGS